MILNSDIESLFTKQVKKDSRITNAFLLVHSDKCDLHINVAEGTTGTGDIPSTPQQPNYMASVGKLFTSVLIGMLYEQKELSFDEKISKYLDSDLMEGLHVYKGKNYAEEIQIRHLLNQSSGLPDHFYPLLDRLLKDSRFSITPREAMEWTKENATPVAPPGKKAFYSDTNYHLLGFIIEEITGKPFHKALRDMIFVPLGMKHSWMLHYSEPDEPIHLPVADFYFDDTRLNELEQFARIDYAGGGVVAPLEEFLWFMKAIVNHQLLAAETVDIMINDKVSLYPPLTTGMESGRLNLFRLCCLQNTAVGGF